eukprot:jgi/Botrbrau1/4950/Bobra.0122s0028.1
MGGRHSRPGRQNQQQQDNQQQTYPRPTVYQQGPPQGHYYGHDAHYSAHPPFYPSQYFGPGRPPYVHHPFPPPPVPAQYPGSRMPSNVYPTQPRLPQPERELTQTATIRNSVNLKKVSLKLVPVNGDSNKLAVCFEFDASQPASVTTFFMVTEDPETACKLMTERQPPSAPVIYETGLNNKYPPDLVEPNSVIDVTGMDDITLATCDRDKETYPLVIRLETIIEKENLEGFKLTDLQPGAPQKLCVQSQTTYAVILRDDEGKLIPKVVKQKIWVKGVSYELQEIYGMEHSAAALKNKEAQSLEDSEERLCVICLVNERDTTVLPCRHMCMCHECAQELRRQTSKCPICRNHVDSLLHIKMQKGGPAPSSPNGGVPPLSAATPALNQENSQVTPIGAARSGQDQAAKVSGVTVHAL